MYSFKKHKKKFASRAGIRGVCHDIIGTDGLGYAPPISKVMMMIMMVMMIMKMMVMMIVMMIMKMMVMMIMTASATLRRSPR